MNSELNTAISHLEIGKPEGYREDISHEDALFDPPLYKQRYLAVAKLINENACTSVVDMGCAECKFLSVIKDLCPTVERLIGVDLDGDLLERKKIAFQPFTSEYILRRKRPLNLRVFCGSIATPDRDLYDIDFYSCIEVIEHLHKDVLDQVPQAIFGYLKPKIVAMTTPNSEYNVLFDNFSGFRHWDHKFEWSRQEFESWCKLIESNFHYAVEICGVGEPPPDRSDVGYCSQMAIFRRKSLSLNILEELNETSFRKIFEYDYPYDDINENMPKKLLDEMDYILNHFYRIQLFETQGENLKENIITEKVGENIIQKIGVTELLHYPGVKKFNIDRDTIVCVLKEKYELVDNDTALICKTHVSELTEDNYTSDYSDTDELDTVYRNELENDGFDEDDEESWE